MDANITEPGESYEKLPETYVIFTTENDVLKQDLPLYQIERVILMKDFYCTDPNDMHYKPLANEM